MPVREPVWDNHNNSSATPFGCGSGRQRAAWQQPKRSRGGGIQEELMHSLGATCFRAVRSSTKRCRGQSYM